MREGRRRPSLRRSFASPCLRRPGRNEGGAPAPLVGSGWWFGTATSRCRNEGGAPAPLVVF